jgi:hypothetical protein
MVKLNPVPGRTRPFRIVAGSTAWLRRSLGLEPQNQGVSVFPERNKPQGSGFTERLIR